MARFGSLSSGEYSLKDDDVVVHHQRVYGDPATGLVTVTPGDGQVNVGLAVLPAGVTSFTGDGTAKIIVDFGREVTGDWYAASGVNPVNKPFQVAQPDASGKATTDTTNTTVLGLCLEVDPKFGLFIAHNF